MSQRTAGGKYPGAAGVTADPWALPSSLVLGHWSFLFVVLPVVLSAAISCSSSSDEPTRTDPVGKRSAAADTSRVPTGVPAEREAEGQKPLAIRSQADTPTTREPAAEKAGEVAELSAKPAGKAATDGVAVAEAGETINPLRTPGRQSTGRPAPDHAMALPAAKAPTVAPPPATTSAGEAPAVDPLPAESSTAEFSPTAVAAEPSSAGRPAGAGKVWSLKHSGTFDPIKDHPIFDGGWPKAKWPKPKVAIVITGRQDGYIEPCGCAGLERMKGGMSRRHMLFRTLRDWGWPVVAVDVGSIGKGFGRQAELKFRTMVDGMLLMGYDGIALGVHDLQLPSGELISVAAGGDGQPNPFVSADVVLVAGVPGGVPAKVRVVEAAGVKFGITAVLGKEFRKEVHNNEIELLDPAAALAAVVPELKQKVRYLILLAHATSEESIALARQFPDFNLVVTAGGGQEPPDHGMPIPGTSALLVEVGEKGMNAVVLGLYEDSAEPVRYQRVPLDSRFEASPQMKQLMTFYQDQLKSLGFAELTPRPAPNPQHETNGNFVDSAKCKDCHEESYKIWKKTPHARAYETLAKLDPPRQFDPECISCHVVGWNPQNFSPYQGGYESFEKTPELAGVGCDSCHGPGEAHVVAEMGADIALQKKLQQAVRVTKAEAEQRLCFTCHDLDNSPDFKFPIYWPEVEHYEKQ